LIYTLRSFCHWIHPP